MMYWLNFDEQTLVEERIALIIKVTIYRHARDGFRSFGVRYLNVLAVGSVEAPLLCSVR